MSRFRGCDVQVFDAWVMGSTPRMFHMKHSAGPSGALRWLRGVTVSGSGVRLPVSGWRLCGRDWPRGGGFHQPRSIGTERSVARHYQAEARTVRILARHACGSCQVSESSRTYILPRSKPFEHVHELALRLFQVAERRPKIREFEVSRKHLVMDRTHPRDAVRFRDDAPVEG